MIYFICAFFYVPVWIGVSTEFERAMAIFPQCANWMIAENWADLLAKGDDINN